MDFLKNNFDFNYYVNENNFKNIFLDNEAAFNHWIHIGIYNEYKCNENMNFLNNINPIINFLKKIDSRITYEQKKNILLNSISNDNNLRKFPEKYIYIFYKNIRGLASLVYYLSEQVRGFQYICIESNFRNKIYNVTHLKY